MAKRGTNFKKNKKKNKSKNESLEELNFVEDYFNRVNKSRKCLKAKEYLSTFENDKESWKFNVKFHIKL